MSASRCLGGRGLAAAGPFRGRLPGAPHIRAVGARLAPARPDPGADVLQGFAHIRGVAQQQALQMLRQPGQAVLEIGLRGRLAGRLPSGLAALRVPVGEQPRHGDQIEVGVQLLLHQTLALAVELVDLQELLADLVHFLDAPAGMIQVRQVGDAVALGVQHGGAQHVGGGGVGVLDEPQRDGPPARAGILAGQVPEGVRAGQDAHERVRAVAVDEAVDGGADVAGQAEDRVQAAPEVSAEQFEAVVAAVVDDQVGGRQGLEMGERGGALVGVGAEVEVDREPGLQAEQAAEQALGVVGVLAGGAVAGLEERPRQGELGAVDGEDAVAEPERSGLLGAAQDLGMEAFEDVLVNARPGLAHGGVGDRPLLGQGHVQGAALGPQLGQRGGVALAAGSEHEAEHEQHHQQRVEDPAALLPAAVFLGGQGAERAEQVLPQGDEVRLGGLRRLRRRLPAALGARPLQQDRAEVLRQRIDIHVLGMASGVGAAPGLADAGPVGGPVAGPAEA